MTKRATSSVMYPKHSGRPIEIFNLRSPDQIARFGASMCGAINSAYANSYEDPNGPLEKGTVVRRYGPQEAKAWTERAVGFLASDSQYWAALAANNSVASFVKLTPYEGTVYVNDVVTRPAMQSSKSHQRRGYASMLLHASLKFGGFDPGSSVWLDAFDASENRMGEDGLMVAGPNKLYTGMGLVAVGPSKDTFTFPDETGEPGSQLFMTEYRTPQGVTLADVASNLEASKSRPWLQNGVPFYG